MINFINITRCYNSLQILMLTSINSSVSKPRRGLSLSLQSKKRQNEHKPAKIEFKQLMKQTVNHSSSHHSGKKNKIKYVQGYKNKQNQSKFKEKNQYQKIHNQDIKLGGGKKNLHCTIMKNQHFNSAINNFRNYQLQAPQLVHFDRNIFQSDRKYMRESKVQNLNSNINYFQNINIGQENTQPKRPFHSTMLLRSTVRLPFEEIEQFQSENLLKSQRLIQNSVPVNAQEITKQTSVIMKQSKQSVQLKTYNSKQTSCRFEAQKNCEALKRKAFVKLQQIQTQIDCLLVRASQAKSLISII